MFHYTFKLLLHTFEFVLHENFQFEFVYCAGHTFAADFSIIDPNKMDDRLEVFVGNEEWNVEHFARHILHEKLSTRTFTMLDLADLVFKCENWKKKMPRVRPYYGSKMHNDIVIVMENLIITA